MDSKAHIVNAVALNMRPLIEQFEQEVKKIVGQDTPVNAILLVGAGDVVQYAANVPRQTGKEMLQDLFARWELNMKDQLPNAATHGNLAPFQYLLSQYARAIKEGDQRNQQNYYNQLMEYVGPLTVKR